MEHTLKKDTFFSKIAFVAGRSGGHILPALTLAQKIKLTQPTTQILFFSSVTDIDKALLKQSRHIVDHHTSIRLSNMPSSIHKRILYCFPFVAACIKSLCILWQHKPSKIISTGGFIGVPVCLAAWVLRIPIELWELNVQPGKAIKMLSRLACSINCVYKHAYDYFKPLPRKLVPYPLNISTTLAQKTLQPYSLSQKKKRILIIGGSQGSFFINSLVIQHIVQLSKHIQLIHQTGFNDYERCKNTYASYISCHKLFDYHPTLTNFYPIADLIVARAGAGTLAEIEYFNAKALVIPLETPDTIHQLHNALEMGKKYPNAVQIVREHELRSHPHLFYKLLKKLISRP